MMDSVNKLLEGIQWDKTISIGSSTIVPIVGKISDTELEILIADENIDGIYISELETESVNEVLIHSNFEGNVLVLAGMVLKGGRQTRSPTRPFIIKNSSNKRIPVNCVEQGRWAYRPQDAVSQDQKEFKVSKKMVSRKTRSSYSRAGYTQSQTWENIQAYMAENALDRESSPTQSYLEVEKAILEKEKEKISEIENNIKPIFTLKDQRGIIIFDSGKLVSVEAFENHKLWDSIYQEVLNANILDLLSAEKKEAVPITSLDFNSVTGNQVDSLVDETAYRLNYSELEGWAVANEDNLVYATLSKFEQKDEYQDFRSNIVYQNISPVETEVQEQRQI